MTRRLPRSLPVLPRDVYRRIRALREGRRERAFRPRLRSDSRAPELLLSPHCDDAALSCWSVLTSDRDLAVVNLFAGVPQPGRAGVWEAVIGARDSAERARERMAEDAHALARAGRKPVNLSLLDAQYRRQLRPVLGPEELDRALTAEIQSASRVYVPAGIGSHVDHLLARRYGRMLLLAGMPVSLYAELPYCTFHGWPPWVDGRAAEPKRDVDAYWQSSLKGVPEMPALRSADVVRLDGPTATLKGEAVRCYETSLNYGVRYLLSDPAFGGFEVRWELLRPGIISPAR
jgi:GlcNAc-PI de-N-acetylase